ncbi:unnamed protein product, partial [Protopolystoma xenopodis]
MSAARPSVSTAKEAGAPGRLGVVNLLFSPGHKTKRPTESDKMSVSTPASLPSDQLAAHHQPHSCRLQQAGLVVQRSSPGQGPQQCACIAAQRRPVVRAPPPSPLCAQASGLRQRGCNSGPAVPPRSPS